MNDTIASKPKTKLAVFLMGIICIFLFALLAILVIAVILQNRSKNVGKNTRFDEYQYIKIHPDSNETSVGFVTLEDDDFGKNGEDFISYTNDIDGSLELVSRVGSIEFECTGSCICTPIDRRASVSILSRGLTTLVAAATSIIAISFAKSRFQDECERKIKSPEGGQCPLELYTITSEVDHCFEIFKKKDKFRKTDYFEIDTNHEDTKAIVKFEDPTLISFICKGWCLVLEGSLTEADLRKFKKKYPDYRNNPCTEMAKLAVIKVYQTGNEGPEGIGFKDYDTAREKFRRLYLEQYCKNSIIEGSKWFGMFFQCYDGEDSLREIEQNIHCRKMSDKELQHFM